jgi:hypothetical protein
MPSEYPWLTLHTIGLPLLTRTASVYLDKIYTPGRVLAGVLVHVPVAPRQSLAGGGAGGRVDTELQPLAMHVGGQRRDARRKERRVDAYVARAVASCGPAVVDGDVLVAGGRHAIGSHGVGNGLDLRLIAAAAAVP